MTSDSARRGLEKRLSPAIARSAVWTLTLSSGCFIASTGFLPSTFTMTALTAATAAMLHGRIGLTILLAVIGARGLRGGTAMYLPFLV